MILALDYGERYIGIAKTDPEGRLALKHSTIDQKKDDAFEVIKKIVADENITRVLVGVPVSLDGDDTEQTHFSLAFMEKLRKELGPDVEIEGADETLTSVEALQNLKLIGGKEEEEHEEAARIILESYLKGQLGEV